MKDGRAFKKPREEEGRPTICTPELTKKIAGFIEQGNYIETACAAAGVPKSRLYEWLKLSHQEDSKPCYKAFRDAIELAMAQGEQRDLMFIDRAAIMGSWQAAAWKLERKFTARWGRKDKLEVTGEDGGPLKVETSEADLAVKIAELEARLKDME